MENRNCFFVKISIGFIEYLLLFWLGIKFLKFEMLSILFLVIFIIGVACTMFALGMFSLEAINYLRKKHKVNG